MDFDLEINKDLAKEAICEKLERLQSMPMILHILEMNGKSNDKLHDDLDFVMEYEFQKIQDEVSKKIDRENNPEEFKEAIEDNSRIFKDNLKKIMKLMGKKSLFL